MCNNINNQKTLIEIKNKLGDTVHLIATSERPNNVERNILYADELAKALRQCIEAIEEGSNTLDNDGDLVYHQKFGISFVNHLKKTLQKINP